MHESEPAERERSARASEGTLAAIFVGGMSTRWGGAPKGLLRLPSGETLVERWCILFDALEIETVLVGAHPAYAGLGIAFIPDEPAQIGPLGGLIALLTYACHRRVITVACDMPYAGRQLVERLVHHPSLAPAVAPKHANVWEPWFARYAGSVPLRIAKKRAARGDHSLQGLLDELGAEPLELSDAELEQLRDWDCPQDAQLAPRV